MYKMRIIVDDTLEFKSPKERNEAYNVLRKDMEKVLNIDNCQIINVDKVRMSNDNNTITEDKDVIVRKLTSELSKERAALELKPRIIPESKI